MKVWQDDDIMLVLTGIIPIHSASRNPKTGPMVQAWVLYRHSPPTNDEAITQACKDCIISPNNKGGCYVNLHQAPLTVWKKYKDYTPVPIEQLINRKTNIQGIRITAYGEPTRVPLSEWHKILNYFPFSTGYTHQWKEVDSRDWGFLMASTHTYAESELAHDLGWSTFRTGDGNMTDNELICRNTVNGVTCFECKLCDGRKNVDIYIYPHGRGKGKIIDLTSEDTL